MTKGMRPKIYAGETSDVWEIGFVASPDGAPVQLADLDPNFACRLIVKGAVPPIARPILTKNAANTRFLAWLTPAETAALGKGSWQVAIELSNPALVPPVVCRHQDTVRIEQGLFTAP